MDNTSFRSARVARELGDAAAARPSIETTALDQIYAAIARIILAPVIVLLGMLVLIDSPGPMLVRVVHLTGDGRFTSRLEFRTHRRFDAESYDREPERPRGTSYYRFLRWSGLAGLPSMLAFVDRRDRS